MLRVGFGPKGNMDRVLVFSRTKHGCDRIVRQLGQAGIAANAIHGNKSQPQRERALAEFKDGKVRILVATDIAARGIDVTGVSHVVNFDLPNVAEQYVHRIGRTARAGAVASLRRTPRGPQPRPPPQEPPPQLRLGRRAEDQPREAPRLRAVRFSSLSRHAGLDPASTFFSTRLAEKRWT